MRPILGRNQPNPTCARGQTRLGARQGGLRSPAARQTPWVITKADKAFAAEKYKTGETSVVEKYKADKATTASNYAADKSFASAVEVAHVSEKGKAIQEWLNINDARSPKSVPSKIKSTPRPKSYIEPRTQNNVFEAQAETVKSINLSIQGESYQFHPAQYHTTTYFVRSGSITLLVEKYLKLTCPAGSYFRVYWKNKSGYILYADENDTRLNVASVKKGKHLRDNYDCSYPA